MITTMRSNAVSTKQPVYCLICARTVEADVIFTHRKIFVKSGQKCPHCSSSLDTGYIVRTNEAA
jgi:DNA-directed RNA polymerase subunit RPC12/RpoP